MKCRRPQLRSKHTEHKWRKQLDFVEKNSLNNQNIVFKTLLLPSLYDLRSHLQSQTNLKSKTIRKSKAFALITVHNYNTTLVYTKLGEACTICCFVLHVFYRYNFLLYKSNGLIYNFFCVVVYLKWSNHSGLTTQYEKCFWKMTLRGEKCACSLAHEIYSFDRLGQGNWM